jgi:hypothetical protein
MVDYAFFDVKQYVCIFLCVMISKLTHPHQNGALVARFEIAARDEHPELCGNKAHIPLHIYFSYFL